jgi:hypothetical protein
LANHFFGIALYIKHWSRLSTSLKKTTNHPKDSRSFLRKKKKETRKTLKKQKANSKQGKSLNLKKRITMRMTTNQVKVSD